jgi:hypothetical protein
MFHSERLANVVTLLITFGRLAGVIVAHRPRSVPPSKPPKNLRSRNKHCSKCRCKRR